MRHPKKGTAKPKPAMFWSVEGTTPAGRETRGRRLWERDCTVFFGFSMRVSFQKSPDVNLVQSFGFHQFPGHVVVHATEYTSAETPNPKPLNLQADL